MCRESFSGKRARDVDRKERVERNEDGCEVITEGKGLGEGGDNTRRNAFYLSTSIIKLGSFCTVKFSICFLFACLTIYMEAVYFQSPMD